MVLKLPRLTKELPRPFQMDGVHPQATGARMLADAIYNAVKW